MAVSKSPLTSWTVGMIIVGLAACGGGEQVVEGDCQTVFEGDLCTWGTMAGDEVTEFGATIPVAFVENAPMEGEMMFPPPFVAVVALPAEVAAATGFNHLGVNWELFGHPPETWLTPHFDFHFYTVTPETVQGIDCADTSKPAELPDEYAMPDLEIPEMGITLVGACVPTMGMHSAKASELENPEVFEGSMIVGYYEEDLIFLEPMIAKAKLMKQESFPMAVPAVPNAPANVKWPSSFEAVYDAEARAYRFVFSGFSSD
ncbi:MAG: DUF5602 domain-containing protein [Planctomycetota bacterium]|jgi:hypothetical protein